MEIDKQREKDFHRFKTAVNQYGRMCRYFEHCYLFSVARLHLRTEKGHTVGSRALGKNMPFSSLFVYTARISFRLSTVHRHTVACESQSPSSCLRVFGALYIETLLKRISGVGIRKSGKLCRWRVQTNICIKVQLQVEKYSICMGKIQVNRRKYK